MGSTKWWGWKGAALATVSSGSSSAAGGDRGEAKLSLYAR